MLRQELPSGVYYDLSESDYRRARVMSYSGGTTWLSLDDLTLSVACKSPIDILHYFQENKTGMVRSKLYLPKL